MIRSPAIFFTILAYWLSGSVVMGSKNDDVAKNILFIPEPTARSAVRG
jgi:hypothetical protein